MTGPAKLFAVTLAGLLLLAGCGRVGDPRLPQGASDDFPRGYPAGAARQTDENILREPVPREPR